MTRSIDPEVLLQHTSWLRVLAVELVGDAHRAEDVLQETWLAALRSPPREWKEEGRLRAWLAAVLRNLALLSRRGEGRRRGRELRAARPEGRPSVEESLQAAETQHVLMEAVMALEPAHREVVVLRYFEELPPREIARRLESTGSAVRSRLSRALAVLRTRLDRRYEGDGRAWLKALLPLAVVPKRTTSIPLGTAAMNAKTKAAIVLAAVIGGGTTIWWAVTGGETSTSQDQSPSGVAAPVVPPEPSEPPPVSALAPEATGERGEVPAGKTDPAPELPSVMGHVEDTDGRPVSDVAVRFHPDRKSEEPPGISIEDERVAVTDERGEFAMVFFAEHGRLVAESDSLVTMLDARLGIEPPSSEVVVVVAPRCDYAGVVLDESGAPVPGASLAVAWDIARLRSLRPGVQRTGTPEWTATADADGRFALDAVGWSAGSRLVAELVGYESVELNLPPVSRSDLLIQFERPAVGLGSVHGRVITEAGEPTEGAWVYLEELSTQTDRDGRFVLERPAGGGTLIAAKEGYLPASLELDASDDAVPVALEPVVLTLRDTPLSISGKVVDLAGAPVEGAHVWTRDGTPVPHDGQDEPSTLEEAVGGMGTWEGSARHRQTREDGIFELSGLLPRAYTVFALHPDTLETVTLGGIEAGSTEVVFVLGGSERARRVAGRVVSYSGDPIPDVTFVLTRWSDVQGTDYIAPVINRFSTITDAEGRFDLGDLCCRGVTLLMAGASIPTGESLALDESMELDDLEIRMPKLCSFQLVLQRDPESADSFWILDEAGELLMPTITLDTTMYLGATVDLKGGRSEVVTSDERARTIVLRKDGEEVERFPVRLDPDEDEQVIRW